MILHHIPLSRSFRVLWMLEELGLHAELKVYSVRDGSTRSSGLLRCSPLGKVPALEFDDGSVMFESPAILQVLAEMYPDSNLDCPAGHRDHRRFLELFGFAETLASEIETLNMQHLFLRDPKDVSLSVMKINTARVKAALKVLDTMLDDQDWLCSCGFSAADIMMSYNLLSAKYFVDISVFLNVVDYQIRIGKRPAFQSACARDGQQEFYSQEFYPIPKVVG